MPRVLITGAAGFIGMHTSIRFLKEGWDVVGLDNMNNYYSVRLKEDRLIQIELIANSVNKEFTFFRSDLNSDVWDSLEKSKYDCLIHLAAQAGVRYSLENPRAYLDSNVYGFLRVLEFVKKKAITNFLYASSSSVYGKSHVQPLKESQDLSKPESYYAATKIMNELMAHTAFKVDGVSSIGLRFFTVYGPWGRPDMAPMIFTNAAFEKKRIKVYNYGNQKRDFTFVDDIVEGIFQLVKSNNQGMLTYPVCEIFNIGQGAPSSLTDFIEQIENYTGNTLNKIMVPEQPGDVKETFADTKKLQGIIGAFHKVTLSVGLKRFIAWYKEYHYHSN